jgi:hypothetical protein
MSSGSLDRQIFSASYFLTVHPMTAQISKIVLPGHGPTVDVSFDGDEIVALNINSYPVIVGPDVEKGDIVVKRGGTSDAYILTDSFDTVKHALKLLERPIPR